MVKKRYSNKRYIGTIVIAEPELGYRIKSQENEYVWLETETVKLILEETPDQNATKEEPTTYTKSEINQQISKAYQHFETDVERLAYLKGYFAK